MTKVEDLRLGIVVGLDIGSDDWDMGQGEEGAATRAHEKKVDDLIAAVREEEEDRLQKYTEKYLKEGIKRCSAALAQGRTEGVTEERARQEAAYRRGEY